MSFNNKHMQIALAQAREAVDKDEVPVGAVVVKQGSVIAVTHNLVVALKDPTAHAELLAIRQAAEKLGSEFLQGCELYVTLEPCPMCAYAISLARVEKLYFGAYDVKSGGVENGPRVLASGAAHHKPIIYGGIMEQECAQLLKDFFKGKR
jgi:tRNA(adenine34) deaminase